MSDEEEEVYAYSDDGGSDAEYAYGSDEDQDEADHEIVNSYYEGEEFMQQGEPLPALQKMERVVELAKERGGEDLKWCFKALENVVSLRLKLGEFEKMLEAYEAMLGFMGAVTRNECTDAINRVLDAVVAAAPQGEQEGGNGGNGEIVDRAFDATLRLTGSGANAAGGGGNERLWFSTKLRQAKSCLAQGRVQEASRVIGELHASCQNPDGSDDEGKATYLMEVYALEIQCCTRTRNTARMKEIFPRTLKLNAAVSDPRIMGVIREEGGKVLMLQRRWSEAYTEFNEAFRAYQEAGNARARDCLKYVVLANILAQSDINPFAATEAKVYQDDKEVTAMMELRIAYDGNDLPKFERTLQTKQNRIVDDPFIMTYVEELRRRMREQVLLSLLGPYKRLQLSFAAKELRLTEPEVEALLVDLILDKRIQGQINQIDGYLLLHKEDDRRRLEGRKHQALTRWADALHRVSAAATTTGGSSGGAGIGGGGGGGMGPLASLGGGGAGGGGGGLGFPPPSLLSIMTTATVS